MRTYDRQASKQNMETNTRRYILELFPFHMSVCVKKRNKKEMKRNQTGDWINEEPAGDRAPQVAIHIETNTGLI